MAVAGCTWRTARCAPLPSPMRPIPTAPRGCGRFRNRCARWLLLERSAQVVHRVRTDLGRREVRLHPVGDVGVGIVAEEPVVAAFRLGVLWFREDVVGD